MKQKPRLRLVPPPAADHVGGGEEPPFTEDELREAADLRGALDRGGDPLASSLRAAYRPSSLDDGDLDAILARALGDGDAPSTRLEREGAETLRGQLEGGGELDGDAAILGDLRAAHRPVELAAARNEELIAGALARAPRALASVSTLRRALPATMATITGILALAAGFALVLRTQSFAPPAVMTPSPAEVAAVAPAALIRSRSTDDLFDPAEKFEVSHTSARIDRIASARSSDLRRNRFAAWGVR